MTTRLLQIAKASLIAAALFLAPAALASPRHGDGGHQRRQGVPEFDPAAGGAIVALLTGGVLFIADRRKGKRS